MPTRVTERHPNEPDCHLNLFKYSIIPWWGLTCARNFFLHLKKIVLFLDINKHHQTLRLWCDTTCVCVCVYDLRLKQKSWFRDGLNQNNQWQLAAIICLPFVSQRLSRPSAFKSMHTHTQCVISVCLLNSPELLHHVGGHTHTAFVSKINCRCKREIQY